MRKRRLSISASEAKSRLPALVLALRDRHRRPGAERPLAAAPAPHRQPFLAVEPEQLLVVQRDAFAPQQDAQATVAEASSLIGKLPEPPADFGIIRTPGSIAIGSAVQPHQRAGAPLRVALLLERPGHG
jgi:hypothetical protein